MRQEILGQLPEEFEIDQQVSFETITGQLRQIIRIPSIPFEIELFDLSEEPFDRSRFSRKLKTSLEGHTVWVPTAEDVTVQKLRWAELGKPEKDVLDAIGVINVRGEKLRKWQ